MKIKSLPPSSRPREKALQKGLSFLNDAELLALILESGVAGRSALEIACALLSQYGGLRGVFSRSLGDLSSSRGLSQNKSLRLLSVYEVHRRLELGDGVYLHKFDPAETGECYVRKLGSAQSEELHLLFLSPRGRVVRELPFRSGDSEELPFDVKKAVGEALKCDASAIVAIHNHPSGVHLPSEGDIASTFRFKEGLEALGVKLKDHLVVSSEGYFSFLENGLLP